MAQKFRKFSVERAAQALLEHHGIMLKAAEALGCSRPHLYAFIEAHPELKEFRKQADQELLDVAESWVTTAIKAGDMKTTRWYLERRGKDRDYTTRQEQTGAGGTPLGNITVQTRIIDPVDDPEARREAERK